MTLVSVLLFLVPVLCGGLVAHLLWPERSALALLLKLSLGAGAGMGLSSMLYFLALLIAPGRISMLPVLLVLLAGLSVLVFVRERGMDWSGFRFPELSRLHWALLALNAAALVFVALIFMNLTLSRPQGAFDAWSIWNRAARFIYRDPGNWQATLSPDLYWGAHADYPLLVPLNVAWGWEAAGMETQRVPLVQGAVFTYASFGVIFAALALARTIGQAGLAALVLMSTPGFVGSGAGLIADVPVTFFIFAACVLIYLHFRFGHPGLLILAGGMAGLAAWTKNEGLLFAMASLPVVAWLGRAQGLRPAAWFLAGWAVPMSAVLYFKIALAPPGDLFARSSAEMLASVTDPSRYWTILKALAVQVVRFDVRPVSIFVQLALYAWALGFAGWPGSRHAIRPVAVLLGIQLLGYCAIYVVTPHDLSWHLGTSLNRLIMHLFPAAVFLFFCAVSDPESLFRRPAGSKVRNE